MAAKINAGVRPMPLSLALTAGAQTINRNLTEAVADYHVFRPTGRDRELIGRINAARVHPGFNVISECLHRSTILALCRVWDKNTDTMNLPRYMRALLKAPGIPERAKDQLRALQSPITAVLKSPELDALRALRHQTLAHTADPSKAYQGRARNAVYGDERKVLETSIDIVQDLNAVIGFQPSVSYNALRELWTNQAAIFWDAVAPADGQT